MKIAVAQIDCISGDVEANCQKMVHYICMAGERECDLIVFPEMMETGYEINAILSNASTWPGYAYLAARNAAMEFGIHIICGISEMEGSTVHNSLVVFDSRGQLVGKYRKIHLMPLAPVCESRHLSAGNQPGVVQLNGITFGLMICYDLRFAELSRALIQRGVQALVICAAWPFPRQHHWDILATARAIENQCYVIASNRVGRDGILTFCGNSRIIDPEGTMMTSASQNREELLVADISADCVQSIRTHFPLLEDLKLEQY